MRHGKGQRKLHRTTKQRQSLMRSLAESLIERGKIKTTHAKAKDLKPYLEAIITRGKLDTVNSSSFLHGLFSNKVVGIFKTQTLPKIKDRVGGCLQINQLPRRKSDGAKMAIIKFVD